MEQRIPDFQSHVPEMPEVAGTLVRAVNNGSVPATTASLVYLRAGQIVGSTYQVLRHAADLRAAGESEARIAAVATWQDAPCYTEAERAALTLTESVFQPSTHGERVPDEVYAEVAKHYDGKALATLALLVATAGFWMNVALVIKPPPAGLEGKAA